MLAAGSALPVVPDELYAFFRGLHRGLPNSPPLKILTPRQDELVTAMAELILPQTDTPGARAARVNEFIDRIVADWYSDQERLQFLAGLADVDARTEALFEKTFVDASPPQQAEILRALGQELAQQADALSAAPRGYRGAAPEPEDNFYFMFRDLTLTGYFTSEVGATKQLHEEIIPGRFEGCIPELRAEPEQASKP